MCFHWIGLVKQICHTPERLRVLISAVLAKLTQIALMQNNEAVAMSGEGCVEEFTRQQPATIGENHESDAELAPLRLVNRQSICQFESGFAFFSEVPTRIVIAEARLGGEFNLGVLYHNGEGVPQDYSLAYVWLNLAAAQGNAGAQKGRDEVAAKLGVTSLAEAQKLSRKYFKLYVEPFQ